MSKLLEYNKFFPRVNFLGKVCVPEKPVVVFNKAIRDSIVDKLLNPPVKRRTTGMSGIYKIECHCENAVYIGQSISIQNRITNHRSSLRSGKHVCSALQADFKKHGESNFIFESIHESDEQDLLNLETFYIQKFRDEGFVIYNSVTYTNNIGMVQCNKDNQPILQKISDLMDSGKIKKGELEEALFYKQNQW